MPDIIKRPSFGIFISVFLACIFKLCSFDLFWHLECGKFFFEHFSIIEQNTFSWTYPDYPWIPTYWLFQVVLYGIWHTTGFTGLILFNAGILASTFMILSLTLEKKGLMNILTLILLIALVDLSIFRFMLRPHIFTFFGLSLLILWTSEPDQFFNSPTLFLKIFLLFLLWVNLHSGVVFGLAFLGIVLFADYFRGKCSSKKALLIYAAALFAAALNPTGTGFLGYVFDHTHLESTISLEEFAPFIPFKHLKQTLLLFFIILPPVLLLLKKKSFPFILPALGFLNVYLIIKGIRFLPEITILWIPVWVSALEVSHVNSPLMKPISPLKSLILGILFAVYLHLQVYPLSDSYLKTGFGISGETFPEKLKEYFHERTGIKLYNSFSLGGYITWLYNRKIPVFQDGRIHAYPRSFFQELEAARNNEEHWKNYLKQFEINTLILNKEEAGPFELDSCRTPPFKVLYEDSKFIFASSQE